MFQLKIVIKAFLLVYLIGQAGTHPIEEPPSDIADRVVSEEAYFAGGYAIWLGEAYQKVRKKTGFKESFVQQSGVSLSATVRHISEKKLPRRESAKRHALGLEAEVAQALFEGGYTVRDPTFHLFIQYWIKTLEISDAQVWGVAGIDSGYFSTLKRGTDKRNMPAVPSRLVTLMIARAFPFSDAARPEMENLALFSAGYLPLVKGRPLPEPNWENYPYLKVTCSDEAKRAVKPGLIDEES